MTVFLSGLLANQSVLDVEVEVGMVCLSAIKTEFRTLIIESSAESNRHLQDLQAFPSKLF
jgi:hypothetical protein